LMCGAYAIAYHIHMKNAVLLIEHLKDGSG